MAWIDGYSNTQFIGWPDNQEEAPVTKPYPDSLWRCDPQVYGGLPFIALFPDIPDYTVRPVKQTSYVSVYDLGTPKTGFSNNGLAILSPSAGEITEDLNGQWSGNLTVPADPEGRWQHIQQYNLLKIWGQLYTIKTCELNHTGSQKTASCYFEHVFYQQADGWIFPIYVVGRSGYYAMLAIKNVTDYFGDGTDVIYDFQIASDIEWNEPDTPPEDIKLWVFEVRDGVTPIDALLGDQGLIAQKGGELFRDNFYYSINNRKEDARDDAFYTRIGKNLTGIRRTVDTTNFASYFRVYDDYGGWWACAWVLDETLQRQFPHHVVRSMRAEKPHDANDPDFDYDLYFTGVVIGQGEAWFRSHCKPIIGYEIDMVEVAQNPEFYMVSDERYVVGDRGMLYDPFLGENPVEVELTSVTRDIVTGRVTRIVIGEQTGFTRPYSPPVLLGETIDRQGGEVWICDANTDFCLDPHGNKIITEV